MSNKRNSDNVRREADLARQRSQLLRKKMLDTSNAERLKAKKRINIETATKRKLHQHFSINASNKYDKFKLAKFILSIFASLLTFFIAFIGEFLLPQDFIKIDILSKISNILFSILILAFILWVVQIFVSKIIERNKPFKELKNDLINKTFISLDKSQINPNKN